MVRQQFSIFDLEGIELEKGKVEKKIIPKKKKSVSKETIEKHNNTNTQQSMLPIKLKDGSNSSDLLIGIGITILGTKDDLSYNIELPNGWTIKQSEYDWKIWYLINSEKINVLIIYYRPELFRDSWCEKIEIS